MAAIVTVVDEDTGERSEARVEDGNYALIVVAPCHLAGEQHHANGTSVLTLRGRRSHLTATRRWDIGTRDQAAADLAVDAPTACPTCQGSRTVAYEIGDQLVSQPCPACCCLTCGEPTGTPPECCDCAANAEADADLQAELAEDVRRDSAAERGAD